METGRRALTQAEASGRSGLPSGNGPELSRGQTAGAGEQEQCSQQHRGEREDPFRETKLAGLIEVQGRWKREEPQTSQLWDETCIYPAGEAPCRGVTVTFLKFQLMGGWREAWDR